MERTVSLQNGEMYHVFNRGAHKGEIYVDPVDYTRFQVLLFLANSTVPIDVRAVLAKYKGRTFVDLYSNEARSQLLVDVLAYSLLPNHFHLVLRQLSDGGITAYLRKLCTAYSMYFNRKHKHSGTLFQGKFRSCHIDSDPYFNWIFAYVHFNPVSVVESHWDDKTLSDPRSTQKFLDTYLYSSYSDYYVAERPERAILAYGDTMPLIEKKSDIEKLLASFGRGKLLYSDSLV